MLMTHIDAVNDVVGNWTLFVIASVKFTALRSHRITFLSDIAADRFANSVPFYIIAVSPYFSYFRHSDATSSLSHKETSILFFKYWNKREFPGKPLEIFHSRRFNHIVTNRIQTMTSFIPNEDVTLLTNQGNAPIFTVITTSSPISSIIDLSL